jgi:hypothetical protein
MNKLLIGHADKTEQLSHTKGGFLLLADDPAPYLEHFGRAVVFDPHRHSFNPLKDMDYKGARDFAALLYGIAPEGQNTLTVRNGKRALARMLLKNPVRLDKLPRSSDPAEQEALGMVDELLLSPVLKNVLCQPTNFSFKPTRQIVARLDRAELGDFDAVVIANLLIGQFQGQIIVPDFGFYGRDFHTTLIRQDRLTAGLTSLSEVSRTLEQALLGIKDKVIYRSTPQDAEKLVIYTKHTEPRNLVELTGNEYF